MNKTLAERFWNKVNIRGEDECWNWKGYILWSGYGRFGYTSKNIQYAHRVAWSLTNGEIPDGMHICHTCDNHPCCNPHHLFIGTLKDNTQDMIQKGRWKKPPTMIGEHNPSAKLTDKKVKKIKELIKIDFDRLKIAQKFNVNRNTIYAIEHGRIWKHVQ